MLADDIFTLTCANVFVFYFCRSQNQLVMKSSFLLGKIKPWIWPGAFAVFAVALLFVIYNHTQKPKTFRERVEQHLGLNGSHRVLEDYVKLYMNDPKSFEHVETKYIMPKDTGVTATVYIMTYRGKNSLGGVVTETIRATCDIKTGKVLNVNTR